MIKERIRGNLRRCRCKAHCCGPRRAIALAFRARAITHEVAPRRLFVEFDGLDLDLLLDQALDITHQTQVIARHQRHRQARRAGPARAADAVHIVLGIEGHVEIDHGRQVDDVEPARRHIGGHQNIHFAALERLERLEPLVLRLVAMQRIGAQAIALERPRQARTTQLGVHENERLLDRAFLQQLQHSAALVVIRNAEESLLHVRRGRVRPRHFHQQWVLQVTLRQAFDLGRERRREQKRLARLGQVAQDALQVRQEADVEHAVSFVEHHVLHLVQHTVLRFDVVQQAARRGDKHLDAGLEFRRLRLHINATVHHGDAQFGVLGI